MKSRSFFLLLLLLLPVFLPADNVRGPVTNIVTLSSETENPKGFELKQGELAIIQLEEHHPFIQGFEIELRIPENLRPYSDSFALYLYKEVIGTPELAVMDFKATRCLFEVLSEKNRYFIRAPIVADHTVKNTPDTFFLSEAVLKTQFPLLLSVLPIMKGMPEAAAELPFHIKVKPINREEGSVQFKVLDENGAKLPPGALNTISFLLDGKSITALNETFILQTGLHTLNLESDLYYEKTVTFGVERGKSKKLDITVTEIVTEMMINVPKGTEVILDGDILSFTRGESIEIRPGEHTILMTIGDYSVSKRFTVDPKKDYNISLFLDIIIDE